MYLRHHCLYRLTASVNAVKICGSVQDADEATTMNQLLVCVCLYVPHGGYPVDPSLCEVRLQTRFSGVTRCQVITTALTHYSNCYGAV